MKFSFSIAAVVLSILTVSADRPAHANPLTYDVSFQASGFTPNAPFDPVAGSGTLILDSAISQTGMFNLNSFSFPVGPVGFDYNQPLDRLRIGATVNGVDNVDIFSEDFLLIIIGATGPSPLASAFVFTQPNDFNEYVASNRSVSVTVATDTVPEPATLALFGIGLAGLGAMRRRRT